MASAESRPIGFYGDIEKRKIGNVSNVNNRGKTRIPMGQEELIQETRIELEGVAKQDDTADQVKIQMDGWTLEEMPFHGKAPCSLNKKPLLSVLLQDCKNVQKILDPEGQTIRNWNKVFLVACLLSLFIDPLFFFLPSVREDVKCIETGGLQMKLILTVLRSVVDIFYVIQIYVKFHTAYVAQSSSACMFERGSLVMDPLRIAARYIKKGFVMDLIVALPLPQVMTWVVIPNISGSMVNIKSVLPFILISQYLPRRFLILPLSSQVAEAAGVVTETAWIGAVYNLTLSILTTHVLGAWWFLNSVGEQQGCWQHACVLERQICQYNFFDCKTIDDAGRRNWYRSSNISHVCNPGKSDYAFGIYGEAVTFKVTSLPFFNRYFYSLWWGLKNLSSLGQGLVTSTYIGELVFAIIIAALGLVLFALLIGNAQRYLQSTSIRLEESRIIRNDTEQWMRQRQLPLHLRESVRRYEQYKWVATRGVNEEKLLKGLPMYLRRQIRRHLCLSLVCRVPLLANMDEMSLDLICERLKPALYIDSTFLMTEGRPVNEMIFIIRGHLNSFRTNGGQTGLLSSCRIGAGDFCGDELLTWALDPVSNIILPLSPRTVQAISEVEAFSLKAEDLKFVAMQCRMFHRKQLRHPFSFYSNQLRTWAALFIQVAWRRYKMKRYAAMIES